MTPEMCQKGSRGFLIAAGGLVLLTVFWMTPLRFGYRGTMGDLLLERWRNSFCSGQLVGILSAAMCWWHWKTRARHLPASGGHWLWMAGIIAGILLYLAGFRGDVPLLSLAMLPVILAFGVLWIAGLRAGAGYLFPILLLYASAPPFSVINLHSLCRYRLYHQLVEWFGPGWDEWCRSAEVSGLYDYYPKPGSCIIVAASLCWFMRGSWKRILAVCLLGAGLACGHMALFGGWHVC